jgi:hypothetical protein
LGIHPVTIGGRPTWVRRAALLALLLTAACAGPRVSSLPSEDGARADARDFVFARDTFTFRNEIRSRYPDVEDLYANYCFVLARGVRQFFLFARFDPTAPRLTPTAYAERVREVAAHSPWDAPLPLEARVVIPGYANLRDFSRAEEAAVKEGLGGRFWTVMHWTNWRVTFPVTRGQQTRVAEEVVDELDHGRLVQLLVTNLPKWELNHTVVAYGYRRTGPAVELTVWDPNNPDGPGTITFDTAERQFWATNVYDTEPGPIRVFRMYYSWFL